MVSSPAGVLLSSAVTCCTSISRSAGLPCSADVSQLKCLDLPGHSFLAACCSLPEVHRLSAQLLLFVRLLLSARPLLSARVLLSARLLLPSARLLLLSARLLLLSARLLLLFARVLLSAHLLLLPACPLVSAWLLLSARLRLLLSARPLVPARLLVSVRVLLSTRRPGQRAAGVESLADSSWPLRDGFVIWGLLLTHHWYPAASNRYVHETRCLGFS